MHAELDEAWSEREESRTAVRGTLADGSAFRALWKACKKLREAMQALEDRDLEVYACDRGVHQSRKDERVVRTSQRRLEATE